MGKTRFAALVLILLNPVYLEKSLISDVSYNKRSGNRKSVGLNHLEFFPTLADKVEKRIESVLIAPLLTYRNLF